MVSHSNADSFWWLTKEKPHEAINGHVKYLRQNQDYKEQANLRYLRLYGNAEIQGFGTESYARVTTPAGGQKNRVTLNIIQSMCDTVTAKIAKNNPKPMFLTNGGDWSVQRKAKKLTKFCEGQFYATKIYEKGQLAFKDATIFGTGINKIYRKGSKICVERVFPNELIVDDVEAIYGEPRSLHQVKWVHKETLKKMYPKFRGHIEMLSEAKTADFLSYRPDTQMVCVTESWHLPSTEDSEDGRHVISIETATLVDEEYKRTYFPFTFLRWADRPLGFWGQGLAEQLQGLQVEINKLLKNIQLAMHLGCIPKIFIEAGSSIVTSHLNNEIGTIIKYNGTKPTSDQLLRVPPELFSHLDYLYNRAYEIAGVSQLSAQSKKPGGLDSGKALREFNDIESERFMIVGQAYERFYMEAARQMIDLAREIYEEEGEYSVKVKGKHFFETIDWSDIDLDEDQYVMQIFPTSGLASTPSGRFQQVQEYLQAGFITREQGIKLLDLPDLEATTDLIVSALDDIEATIERMLDKGEYLPPEPFQNLQLGIQMVQQAYLKHKNNGAPDEVLELLRNWIEDAQALITPPEPMAPPVDPTMPPPELVEPPPLGVPEAAPQSDLLPMETAI